MVELVELMLKLHKDLPKAKTPHEQESIQRQIAATGRRGQDEVKLRRRQTQRPPRTALPRQLERPQTGKAPVRMAGHAAFALAVGLALLTGELQAQNQRWGITGTLTIFLKG